MDPKDFFNRDDKKSNSSAFRLNDTLNSHKNPKGHRIRRYLGSSVAVLTGILIVASPSVLTYTIPEMTKQMKEEYVKVINYVYQKKQPENPTLVEKPEIVIPIQIPKNIIEIDYQDETLQIANAKERVSHRKILTLEEIVQFKDYRIRELTPWENITLARLIPLKSLIEKESNYYSIDPEFATRFFILESSMIPIDINPQLTDFGLGQININSLEKTLRMVKDPKNPYFNPRYNSSKGIFDPHNNIILSLASLKSIKDRRDLSNYDLTYAVYVRGDAAVDENFMITDIAKREVRALNERKNYIAHIIPLFLAKSDDLNRVNDDVTKGLMKIHKGNVSIEESYKLIADLLYYSLFNNEKDKTYNSILFEDTVAFHVICNELYKYFSNKKFDNLVKKGKELLGIPKDQEYSNRIKRSVMYLNASRYNKPPFDALRMINKNTSSKKPI